MSAALSIIAPGLHTTVQDLGRFGYQALGVPVAGALDRTSLRLANALVGNPPEVAALEVLLNGPTVEVLAESARVAVAGADAEIVFEGEPPRSLPPWQSVRLRYGERLRIGSLGDSACCYLAIEGGFALPSVLDSLSTFARSRIGGHDGRILRAGDALPLVLDVVEDREEVRLATPPVLRPPERFRVVLGPQREYFSEDSIAAFLHGPYRVTHKADRMGLRLEGPKLAHALGYNIVSDGIATGSIQVPGSGQPIILLADHQTTGGYPKIGTLISADLPAAGRLRPGDALRFEAVSVGEAEAARRALEAAIIRAARELVPVNAIPARDSNTLFDRNLVSGVISANE